MNISRSALANAAGVAVVTLDGIPSGVEWVVAQINIESLPARSGSVVTIRLNGRFIASSIVGNAGTASGSPFVTCSSHDLLTVSWSGMTLNDSVIATFLYSEYLWGSTPGGVAVV